MSLTQPIHQGGSPGNPAELTQIGNYLIREVLYSTSERTTYRAASTHNNKEVLITLLTALRLPASIPLRDSANILRMRSSDLARFKHQNVLSVIDAGECNGVPFVVHDFIGGIPLSAILSKYGALGFEQFIACMVRIAAAVDAAHSMNVYHGAIRSESILIDSKGHAFLADLGIEYILQPLMMIRIEDNESDLSAQLTYQPLERINSPRLDRKGDLYSLAATAFEALTGRLIVGGETIQEVKDNIREGQLRSVTEFISNLPMEINLIFDKALAQQPKRRFDSGHEFVCTLARQLGIEPLSLNFTEPRPVKPEPRVSKPFQAQAQPRTEFSFTAMDVETEQVSRSRKPGSPFAHVKEQWSSSIPFIPRNPLFFWGGCLLLLISSLCGWYLYSIETTPIETPSIIASDNAEALPVGIDTAGYEELEAPRVLPVPFNAPVESLQDRELLGLIWSNTASEKLLLDGLHEAESRHLADLVNAAVNSLNNESATVRAEAARVVGTQGDKRIVPFLMALLQDTDPMVRREAARAIGALGEHKALSYISARYIVESTPEVRIALRNAIQRVSGYPVTEAEIAGFAR